MTDSSATSHAAPMSPVMGGACGLLAAVGYSAANVALRASVETDALLVSAMKAVPTILACAPLLTWMAWRGRPCVTSWRTFPLLIVGTITGQLLGNFLFQVALGIIGLALAVPLNLSAMIISGALFGKWILGDPVSRRTMVAIAVLIAASVMLSLGSDSSAINQAVSWQTLAGGLVAITVSGAAYSFFGVTMRRSLRQGITVPLAMLTSGITGVTLLFPLAWWQVGPQAIADTSVQQWAMMATAGLMNTAAFFMLSFSLRSIPVVAVNLLNATQAMMAALMGVLLFAEPLTATLIGGSLLTVAGLIVLGTGSRRLPNVPPPQATSPKSSTEPYRRNNCDLSPNKSSSSNFGSASTSS